MRWRSGRARIAGLLAGLCLGSLFPPAAEELRDPDAEGLTLSQRFAALVARTGRQQSQLRTLEAAFVQIKESPMLLEPEESRGRFSFRAPDQVRWDFVAPTAMVVLIDEREMVTWYRELRRVERVGLGRQSNHVLRLMGASSSLESLKKYFSIRASFPRDRESPYRLELEPLSPRVGRRIEAMTLGLDRELFLPVFVRFVEPGGTVTEIRFEDLRLNLDLPLDRFELDLPDDVEEHSVDLG